MKLNSALKLITELNTKLEDSNSKLVAKVNALNFKELISSLSL